MITWVFYWLARLFYHALLVLFDDYVQSSEWSPEHYFLFSSLGLKGFLCYFLLQIYKSLSYHHHCHLTTGKYPPNARPVFLVFCLLFIFEKNHHLLRIFVSADEWKSTWSLEKTVFTLGSKLVVSWICNMITHAVLVFCLLVCLRFILLLVQSWILEDGQKFSNVRLCKVWKYLFCWVHSSLPSLTESIQVLSSLENVRLVLFMVLGMSQNVGAEWWIGAGTQ